MPQTSDEEMYEIHLTHRPNHYDGPYTVVELYLNDLTVEKRWYKHTSWGKRAQKRRIDYLQRVYSAEITKEETSDRYS